MQVHVELPEELDVDEHARAHARDEIPGAVPYGLDHLADDDDVTLSFRRPLRDPRLAWLAHRVRNRMEAHEVVGALAGAASRVRRDADVVFCMDERTGLPAALVPGPPVVSHLIWLLPPENYGRARREVTRRALHRMAGVVVTADGLVAQLRDGWGVDPARIHVARVGLDTDFFAPQPWTEGTTTVASVGDDPYRDHPLLIEAVRRLRAGGRSAYLELGTTMPEVTLPDESMGVLHRRRMEGAVRGMYRRAGVVALALTPSDRGSGSTVVLEAAASGRPIVATRTPAMAELVADGERGLLVDPDDPDAFAAALGTLLAHPDRARAMGAAARRWVETTHTDAHRAADLRVALRDAVARGRP